MNGKAAYKRFVAQAAASLEPDEYWCVEVEGRPLAETASKDMTHPVRLFCTALKMDWDEATEQGVRLTTIKLPAFPTPGGR